MTELDDTLLRGAFMDYSNETSPQIKPAGVAAAQDAMRRRRRTRSARIAALAIVLCAIPVTVYALHSRPSGRPSTAQVTLTPTPDNPFPSPSESAPPGGFRESELKNATVTLRPWTSSDIPGVGQCPSGTVRLYGTGVGITSGLDGDPTLTYGDVDHDGKPETIARIECPAGDQQATQLVAFGRDNDGHLRTLGTIIETTQGVQAIDRVVVMADGKVRVEVGPHSGCCDNARFMAYQHQWRTFSWNGTNFVQVAGRTAFRAEPLTADLRISVTPFEFTEKVNGVRTGVISFDVINVGSTDVSAFEARLVVQPSAVTWKVPAGWNAEAQHDDFNSLFNRILASQSFGPLAVGKSRRITIQVTTTLDSVVGAVTLVAIPLDANGDPVVDRTPENNGELDGRLEGVSPLIVSFN